MYEDFQYVIFSEAEGHDGEERRSIGHRHNSVGPLTTHPERIEVRAVFNSGDNNDESANFAPRDDFGISDEAHLPLVLNEFASGIRISNPKLMYMSGM